MHVTSPLALAVTFGYGVKPGHGYGSTGMGDSGRADCTKNWENCLSTGCCENSDYLCYVKDESYAECRLKGSCVPEDDWTCELLPFPGVEPTLFPLPELEPTPSPIPEPTAMATTPSSVPEPTKIDPTPSPVPKLTTIVPTEELVSKPTTFAPTTAPTLEPPTEYSVVSCIDKTCFLTGNDRRCPENVIDAPDCVELCEGINDQTTDCVNQLKSMIEDTINIQAINGTIQFEAKYNNDVVISGSVAVSPPTVVSYSIRDSSNVVVSAEEAFGSSSLDLDTIVNWISALEGTRRSLLLSTCPLFALDCIPNLASSITTCVLDVGCVTAILNSFFSCATEYVACTEQEPPESTETSGGCRRNASTVLIDNIQTEIQTDVEAVGTIITKSNYELTFTFALTGRVDNFNSILHIGPNDLNRNPAFFLSPHYSNFPNSIRIGFRSNTFAQFAVGFGPAENSPEFNLDGTEYSITITVCNSKVFIDVDDTPAFITSGELSEGLTQGQPPLLEFSSSTFDDVPVYAGQNWRFDTNPAVGYISNLVYTSLSSPPSQEA